MFSRSDTDDDEDRAGHIRGPQAIRLVGPGGAGKSTIGALLAERLELAFIDLDRHLAGRIGDISEYIGRHGYDAYARENVETYRSLFRPEISPAVVALSSGFMTYARDIHPEYSHVRRDLNQHPNTFVLLPSFDRDEIGMNFVAVTRPSELRRDPRQMPGARRCSWPVLRRRRERMRPRDASPDPGD